MATALSDIYGPQSGSERMFVPDLGYRPGANEEFMNPVQLAYFKQKLLNWKDEILRESQGTIAQL
jgi:DnaK suppressor protein